MSRTEHIRGKLIEIDLIDGSIELTCKKIFEDIKAEREKNGKSLTGYDYEGGVRDFLLDEMYNEYVITSDGVFKVIEKNEVEEDEDIFKAERNPDDSISYEVKYYNGGCGFGKAIERSVNRMTK